MELIGSKASPYVRRIRILLESSGMPFEFKMINIFEREGYALLKEKSLTKRVPVLIDNGDIINDSFLITKYIYENKLEQSFDFELERLFHINDLTDSGLILFQLKFFDLDKDSSNPMSRLQINRIHSILEAFNQLDLANLTDLEQNWLFCTLDWFSFRSVFDFSKFKNLVALKEDYQKNKFSLATDPRE